MPMTHTMHLQLVLHKNYLNNMRNIGKTHAPLLDFLTSFDRKADFRHDSFRVRSVGSTVNSNISFQRSVAMDLNNFDISGQSRVGGIDIQCEKAMIEFIYYHKAAKIANLDVVWREFLRIYPIAEDEDVGISDLKWHYLSMKRTTNRWHVTEEQFLYFKYGAYIDDEGCPGADDEDSEEQDENSTENGTTDKILKLTFDRSAGLNTGLSLEGYRLYIEAFGRQNE